MDSEFICLCPIQIDGDHMWKKYRQAWPSGCLQRQSLPRRWRGFLQWRRAKPLQFQPSENSLGQPLQAMVSILPKMSQASAKYLYWNQFRLTRQAFHVRPWRRNFWLKEAQQLTLQLVRLSATGCTTRRYQLTENIQVTLLIDLNWGERLF